MARLKYVSQKVLDDLIDKTPEHIDRYVETGFEDLAQQIGWAVETVGVEVDYDRLQDLKLDRTSGAVEVHNSLVVHDALSRLRRAVARDERIWVRLTHIECIRYARARWLTGVSTENLEKQIKLHFFAGTLNQTRDDNAISRLWWNGEIATTAFPEDRKRGLELILRTADTRLSLVERSRSGGRRPIIRGIVRALDSHAWLTEKDTNFRRFMKMLNVDGGGVLYEALPESAVDELILTILDKLQNEVIAAA